MHTERVNPNCQYLATHVPTSLTNTLPCEEGNVMYRAQRTVSKESRKVEPKISFQGDISLYHIYTNEQHSNMNKDFRFLYQKYYTGTEIIQLTKGITVYM